MSSLGKGSWQEAVNLQKKKKGTMLLRAGLGAPGLLHTSSRGEAHFCYRWVVSADKIARKQLFSDLKDSLSPLPVSVAVFEIFARCLASNWDRRGAD